MCYMMLLGYVLMGFVDEACMCMVCFWLFLLYVYVDYIISIYMFISIIDAYMDGYDIYIGSEYK